MKITQVDKNKKIKFVDYKLKTGDVFNFENEYYIVNNTHQITNLSSGSIINVGDSTDGRFHLGMLVTPVEAELFIS